jgi:DNA-binding NarL/FixJ family response regulator
MPDKNKINIIITDDSPTFIAALSELLSTDPRFNIIDTCCNGLELTNNKNLIKAHLLLIDIEMPKMNGLEAARSINFKLPTLPMIALTMHQEKVYLADIVRSGFRAFVFKPEIPSKLLNIIDLVLQNKFIFPDNLKIDK